MRRQRERSALCNRGRFSALARAGKMLPKNIENDWGKVDFSCTRGLLRFLNLGYGGIGII